MKKVNEQGHVVNLANYKTLTAICDQHSSIYTPYDTSISVAALQSSYVAGYQAAEDVRNAEILVSNAKHDRKQLYKQLKPIAARVYRSLTLSHVSEDTLAEARGILRLMRGGRADKSVLKPDANGVKAKTVSVSHVGVDHVLDNFKQMIRLVTTIAAYQPYEADLKVTGLQALADKIDTANIACTDVVVKYNAALRARNRILYTDPDSLHKRFMLTKNYLRSVFGFGSPELIEVNRLTFVKYS